MPNGPGRRLTRRFRVDNNSAETNLGAPHLQGEVILAPD
jgi:hypothetical protein